MIEARDLVLRYGSQTILDKVSFSLQSGRITALIGPNGAGKSSAFRIMAGLVTPEHGEAWFDHVLLKSFKDLRKSCGYLLEAPDFYPYLSGKENLDLLIRLSGSHADAASLLELVGLADAADKKVRNYSRGMKQRLGMAQVMTDDPAYLILDEPFNGLDPEVREQMLAFLTRMKNQGKGILVSTHQLDDIETITDDFIFLNRGVVFLSGAMHDYHDERQNVTLFFSTPLPGDFDPGAGFTRSPNTLKATLGIGETEDLLKNLYAKGLVPYRVNRSGILHDKYMEMTR
ncbi:MAG: ABC transporter ATP-binding protein [Bacteroidetes bacterium]|nr:ABC transporter ATP-binding protein [Bacteroidota bacterium]